jgi:predicted protein tyrosine phosphatase
VLSKAGNGSTPRFATNTSLVSETHFSPPCTVENLIHFLRQQKTTGQLVIHFHMGGIQRISLLEKTAVDLVE